MGRYRPTRARRSRRATVPAAAALLLAALCAGTGPDRSTTTSVGQSFDPATVQKLDAAITKIMKQTSIPGLNIGLWMPRCGVYEKSFGVADKQTGTPMKSDLYTRIGSVTKTFTVTGVLQLVDRGKVGLDDPISQYVSGVPGGDVITVRQLAEMRSGLFNYTDDERWLAALRSDPHRSYTPRQLLDIAFRHPPTFEPGAKWEYSNTNTTLLGMLVEKVSGQSLGDYLQEHVFTPLKLTDTSLPGDSAMPDPHAHGYTNFTPTGAIADATNWNPSWAWAAGGIISDLDDLHTWVPALADGRLLTRKTQAERLRTLSIGIPGASYGLGILNFNGWLGHNGDLPGYESIAAQLPTEQASLVILINTDTDYKGKNLSTVIGNAVTSIVTPDHPWSRPASTQPKQSPAPSNR
ncbi:MULTISPECIES: serine hydrolase domain-containing protein [unclassified Streptomyces]|uniref:serine hydrolase domain-containing protein n=1 Tax=unclassified Streptomyces TaxID=2593676 RepID=UPI002DD80319|nr:serine hydrolase domain-containing protein [Streptomyces sp. NBC_01750]WSA99109.1 beta-lactamase family protein [Streptomyces sp. NBC_01794]WSD36326.1 beta-lactamase family protein [Streptomyces sp. NBC_01750]